MTLQLCGKRSSRASLCSSTGSDEIVEMPSYDIKLEPEEERLFKILVEAADWHQAENEGPFVELRVAGGWVRDKILGLWSHDVDIALDAMMGVEYANVVAAYFDELESQGKVTPDKHFHKIGVIGANPEQSKHLETATMKIFDIEVDFVNLRAEEEYHAHSRIPHNTKMFGTPLEDCMRRDFTINALFYNLRTCQVEDYTERGLRDLLSHRLIETPLCPHTTFHDDPLRVLRAIRFAVRYNFQLADDLRKAATSSHVQNSLNLKVSRERIGKELTGMLLGKGATPHKAMDLILQFNLQDTVFALPLNTQLFGTLLDRSYTHTLQPHPLRHQAWLQSKHLINLLPTVQNPFHRKLPSIDIPMLHLATLLYPFSDLYYIDNKQKQTSVLTFVIKESLKFKNKDVLDINAITENIPTMRHFIQLFKDNPTGSPMDRLQAGLLLRELKELWLTCLLVAAAIEIHESTDENDDSQKVLDAALSFHRSVFSLELEDCWNLIPHLNGKDLIPLLGLSKGPIIGAYLEEQIKWMLRYPNKTREECEAFLVKRREERKVSGLDDALMKENGSKKKQKKKS